MSYEITTQHLVNAWVDAVIEELKTVDRLHDKCRDEGDGKWFPRSTSSLWGSYWTIRKISGALSYSESSHVELAMDNFLNQYCEALNQTHMTSEESA